MNKKHNIFFMDIFNNILMINNINIIIIYDINGNIWFGLRDLLKTLGYTSLENALSSIKISSINKQPYNKINPSTQLEGSRIKPNKLFINESGLYELLSISTKPLARIFMDKYFSDIMPKIRQSGKYILDVKSKKELDAINKQLKLIKHSNTHLLINQKTIIYPNGIYIYIINNKIYYKIGYTSNLNRRIKIYNTGNVNKIYFNYIIKVANQEIDTCIKKIMKNKEYIKNKEFYKISLKNALYFIKQCSPKLKTISCGYCLKSYSFAYIHSHKC